MKRWVHTTDEDEVQRYLEEGYTLVETLKLENPRFGNGKKCHLTILQKNEEV